MPTGQQFSSVAVLASLTAGMTNAQTTCTVNTVSGFPVTPFTIALDPGQANQELCDVTNVTGLTLTLTRAVDGSTASAHSNNAVVMHAGIGRDFREYRSHVDASSSNDASGHSVHGLAVASSVVGTTDAQTLTNKTLTVPTLNQPNLNGSGGALTLPAGPDTLVGRNTTDTLINKTLTSPTINNETAGTSGPGSIPLIANHATAPTTDIFQAQINGVGFAGIDSLGGVYTDGINSLVKARFAGTSAGGPPTTGTYLTGDFVVDKLWGISWICINGGTSGTWRPSGPANLGTITSAASFPSWTGIPTYFTSLRIVWSAVGAAAGGGNGFDELYIRFNNDSAADYSQWHIDFINASALAGVANSSVTQPRCGATTNGATSQAGGVGVIDIPNYTNALQKQYAFQTSASSGVGAPNNHYQSSGGGVWNSTAAINRVDIAAISGTLFNAAQFTLYAL